MRNGRDILFRAFPTKIGIHGKTAGLCTVVAAQVEDGLVVADAGGTGCQFILREIEPLLRGDFPVPNNTGDMS